MDRRFSLGDDACKCKRWILFWWSYMSSPARAKIIKVDLQRSPTDSTCCATPGKTLGETSALPGRRTGAASTETFFWCVIPPHTAPGNGNCVWSSWEVQPQQGNAIFHGELLLRLDSTLKTQITGRWHVWKELTQWLHTVCLHLVSFLMKWLGTQPQNFQGKETEENEVLGI